MKAHKKKLKMARKMMSKDEIKRHVSPFQSDAWEERALRRKQKQLNQKNKKK